MPPNRNCRPDTFGEYSFGLHTLNLGDKTRRGVNPFTGETVIFHIDEGLSTQERNRVQEVFDLRGICGPEPDDEGYALYSPGGESIRFRGNDLRSNIPLNGLSVELAVKELSAGWLAPVLEVARAGNLAIIPAVGEENVCVVDGLPSEKVLSRWPDARSISSAEQLRSWLEAFASSREVRRFV